MPENCLIVVRSSKEFLPMRILRVIQRSHPRLQVKYKSDFAGVEKLLDSGEYTVKAVLLKGELDERVSKQLKNFFASQHDIDLYIEDTHGLMHRLNRKTGKYLVVK